MSFAIVNLQQGQDSGSRCLTSSRIHNYASMAYYLAFGTPGAGDLKKTVRDLNGDGKDELILYSYLDSDGYRGAQPTPMWPKVYRLQNGKYIEANVDFPDFYTDEVLPQVDKEISNAQRLWPPGSPGEAGVAVLEMQRDKILRMLGRNPTAGLEQARGRANSQNLQLVENAIVVFRDMGGHEEDVHAAELAAKSAAARDRASTSK